VTNSVNHESLMRYLDGEATPEERSRIEEALTSSTELQRDVAIFGAMKRDLQGMTFPLSRDPSVWGVVNRRITRPVGWVLIVAGFAVWTVYGSYLYFSSAIDPWEKLATAAIGGGTLLLFSSVIYERYKEWLVDPYRDVYK